MAGKETNSLSTEGAGEKENSSQEEDLLRRSTKKIKNSSDKFTGSRSGGVCYEDIPIIRGDEEVEIRKSYRDSLIGNNSDLRSNDSDDTDDSDDEDLSDEEDRSEKDEEEESLCEIIEHQRGKHSIPEFIFKEKVKKRINKPFRNVLIVKLLGRMIGYKALESKLQKMWGNDGDVYVVDTYNDFYVVKFTSKLDYEFALGGGPWMIYDHYLMIRTWCPFFNPWAASVDRVMVWIRFPELPLEYYDEEVLRCFGNRIGKAIKVDFTTSLLARGKFARMCVEVDTSLPLLPVFIMEGREFKVEYEGLHTVCFHCGRYGHLVENCPEKIIDDGGEGDGVGMEGKGEAGKEDSLFGPWTTVKKNRRPRVEKNVDEGKKNVDEGK